MDLSAPVDLYCERVGASFWAEPCNAASNLAFVAAAWLVWRLSRRLLPEGDRDVDVLVGAIAVVGVGSALFHTFASVWSRWADVVPIVATLLWLLWLFLRRALGLSRAGVGWGFAAFGATSAAFTALVPARLVNGSNTYFSCAVALATLGALLRRRGGPGAGPCQLAAGLFGGSLFCRSIDLAACAAWPLGTHFLWHLLNGATLLTASRGLLLELARSEPGDEAHPRAAAT